MASITMASFPTGAVVADRPCSAKRGGKLVVAKFSIRSTEVGDNEQVQLMINTEKKEMSSNGRREMVFAAAAAVACSIMGGAAFADEPKRGTPEAKKVYAPICVTMPTARICHK